MRSPKRPLSTVMGTLAAGLLIGAAVLVRLGLTYGSTPNERKKALPGDTMVERPNVVTNHPITIDAPPEDVWPWLVQMGWGRAQWYTARWVDRLLFPDNGPSTEAILPQFQELHVGDFVPDGPPETGCGFVVEVVEPNYALVLHSTTHIPRAWRARASLDWSWAFVLESLGDGRRTRFAVRSRWVSTPWWLTGGAWLGVVPADFVMARDMLRGVKRRAERVARTDGSQKAVVADLTARSTRIGREAATRRG